jgi:PilZ domain-containing protein
MSFGKRQPVGFSGVERRREVRENTDVEAQIVLPAGQNVKCRVSDFSKTGARLTVGSAFGLPNVFELRAGGRIYQVMLTRRGIGHVAVKFI